jgi:ATP-dependent DNA helicase RecG
MSKAVQYLKGVGPARARHLARLGIQTTQDLIRHYPRDYKRRQRVSISQLPNFPGETVIISGNIVGALKEFRRRVNIINVTVADSSGYVRCTWFNQSYLRDKLRPGQTIFVAGKYSSEYGGNILVEEFSIQEELPEIQPLYSLTEGISNQVLSRIIGLALAEHHEPELFPEDFREKYQLMPRGEAVYTLHFPRQQEDLDKALYTGKFSELLLYQLSFLYWRQEKSRCEGYPLREIPCLLAKLESVFGFKYYPDQVKAVQEIGHDMQRDVPMNRLLQGDVGSGKTAVAAHALFTCALNGYKGVLMVPTEIVARQHYNYLEPAAGELGVKLHLLSGSTKKSQRDSIHEDLVGSQGVILVGTHAVFQADVEIRQLALVVTDEQHRFGVQQRLALTEKGRNSHVLAMSATPIPRTLAMTLYCDLDISIITHKPPGRKEIKTRIVHPRQRQKVFDFVAREMNKGNSGYIICPLIEESEEIDALSLQEYEQLLAQALPGYKYGVLHGRLTGGEKDQIIADLHSGRLHFLLATTVVEVGVDIGNATFIVVENSERYGLAQLHQLRGRVGRRELQSYCFLMAEGQETERLKIMEQTNDGFAVAMADLDIRGSGQFLGQRQHGLNEFKLADVVRDGGIARTSRKAAEEVLGSLGREPTWSLVESLIKGKVANLKS